MERPAIEGTQSIVQRNVGVFSDVADGYQISKQSTWRAPAKRLPLVLRQVLDATNKHFEEAFDMVLLNHYVDGSDSIAPHYDNPKGNGLHCVVTISLGATRDYTLTCRQTDEEVKRIPMCHGDVLVMSNAFQWFYKHSIPKTDQPCGPRISLTMRKYIPKDGALEDAPKATMPQGHERKQPVAKPCRKCDVPVVSACGVCPPCFALKAFKCTKCEKPYGAPWLCESCWTEAVNRKVQSQKRTRENST